MKSKNINNIFLHFAALLHTAPDLVKGQILEASSNRVPIYPFDATEEGDIYSMGVVFHEILTRRSVSDFIEIEDEIG